MLADSRYPLYTSHVVHSWACPTMIRVPVSHPILFIALVPWLAGCADTQLRRAVESGDAVQVKRLLTEGADVNSEGSEGTALVLAARNGNADIVQALLAKGADKEARDKAGWTALMLAAYRGHVEAARALLAAGANTEAEVDGSTSLMWATSAGRTEIVRDLISKGANIEAANRAGWTPLMLAAQYRHLEILRELLEKGAKTDTQNRAGDTALLIAVTKGDVAAANALLGKGAKTDIKNRAGNTALLIAVTKGDVAAANALVASGADIQARDRAGKTPLMAAANSGNDEIAKSLLEKAALIRGDVGLKDNSGKTALDIAHGTGHTLLAGMILKYEANLAGSTLSKEDVERIATAAALGEKERIKTAGSEVDKPKYQIDENPDNYALVIGIDKYAGLPEAEYAEHDAQAMRDHLAALGYPQRNIVSLLGSDATKAGLLKSIENWLEEKANERSTIFFYYAGHGAPSIKSEQPYLVPWDGDPEYLEVTAYPIKRLYEKLASLKAKRIIVALDACFSGAGGRSVAAKGMRPIVAEVEQPYIGSENMIVLSASSRNQVSGTMSEEGHGVFTYFLLKGLNGAAADATGHITVQALYDYVAPKVEDEARKRSHDQTPQLLPPSVKARPAVPLR